MAIDHDLELLQKLNSWKTLPIAERPSGLSDDVIENVVREVKTKMRERSGQRESIRPMAEIFEAAWKKTFQDEYWQDWLKRVTDWKSRQTATSTKDQHSNRRSHGICANGSGPGSS